MYLRAEKKLPKYEYYGAFMQIGNGVGLVREFLDGISLNKDIKVDEEYHLITGVTFYPILCEVAEKLSYSYGVKLFVHKITNKFFGESITVAGLITAQDIINQLKDKLIGKKVIIPSEMLKEFQDITLDGMSIEELEKQLQATISICHGGEGLEDIICGV